MKTLTLAMCSLAWLFFVSAAVQAQPTTPLQGVSLNTVVSWRSNGWDADANDRRAEIGVHVDGRQELVRWTETLPRTPIQFSPNHTKSLTINNPDSTVTFVCNAKFTGGGSESSDRVEVRIRDLIEASATHMLKVNIRSPHAVDGGDTQDVFFRLESRLVDTEAPTAELLAAPMARADGTYEIKVRYTDNLSIDVQSAQGHGVVVLTAEDGSQVMSASVSDDSVDNGSPRVVTYLAAQPAPDWRLGPSHKYRIGLVSGKLKDTSGNVAPATDLGMLTVPDQVPPSVTIRADDVKRGGEDVYSFQVAITDNVAVDTSSLDSPGLFVVSGHGGYREPAHFVSLEADTTPESSVAIFSIRPPGGIWSHDNSGLYKVELVGTGLTDTSGNAASPGASGQFHVNVPDRNAVGPVFWAGLCMAFLVVLFFMYVIVRQGTIERPQYALLHFLAAICAGCAAWMMSGDALLRAEWAPAPGYSLAFTGSLGFALFFLVYWQFPPYEPSQMPVPPADGGFNFSVVEGTPFKANAELMATAANCAARLEGFTEDELVSPLNGREIHAPSIEEALSRLRDLAEDGAIRAYQVEKKSGVCTLKVP